MQRAALLSTTFALAPSFARRVRAATSWGLLIDDPEGRLDLPAGFSYVIVQAVGDTMTDGHAVPGAPDGMACFEGPGGTLVLMRNHEIASGGGGVTRLVLDRNGELLSSNWVIRGTSRNCAGGPSPWGWLTCEEIPSGNVFLCDVSADEERDREQNRIAGYGSFNHEAVAIDPSTNIAYLTEDETDGCLYRFVPDDPAEPFEGRLQALRVLDEDTFHTGGLDVADTRSIGWVDVPDPSASSTTVRTQAKNDGAAVFVRGEGIWFRDGAVVFTCTAGGSSGRGQIFELVDTPNEPSLTVVAVGSVDNEMDQPDNVTISPWGHIVVVEDRDSDACHIRVLDFNGELVPFGRVASGNSELAGICFSPDGRFMFVNSQVEGLTYRIEGPFAEILGDGMDPGGGDETGATGADDGGSGDGAGTGGDHGTGGSQASTGSDDSGSTGSGDSGSIGDAGVTGDDTAAGCGGCTTNSPSADGAALTGLLIGAIALDRKRSQGSGSRDDD